MNVGTEMTRLTRTIGCHSCGWLLWAAPAFAVALGFAAAPVSAGTAVVPPARSSAEGSAHTTMPFNCASSGVASQRDQQAHPDGLSSIRSHGVLAVGSRRLGVLLVPRRLPAPAVGR
jgi:hypothetical protein